MQPPTVTPEPSGPEAGRLGDAGKTDRGPLGPRAGSPEVDGEAVSDAKPLSHQETGKVRDVIDVTWDRLDVGDDVIDLYGDDITDLDSH